LHLIFENSVKRDMRTNQCLLRLKPDHGTLQTKASDPKFWLKQWIFSIRFFEMWVNDQHKSISTFQPEMVDRIDKNYIAKQNTIWPLHCMGASNSRVSRLRSKAGVLKWLCFCVETRNTCSLNQFQCETHRPASTHHDIKTIVIRYYMFCFCHSSKVSILRAPLRNCFRHYAILLKSAFSTHILRNVVSSNVANS
jgi:hypothetical protein